MPTLLLLRHAKSSWDDPELGDHERPLNKRGSKSAPRIGRYLDAAGLIPDLVLSSDAVRTRATVALVLAELSNSPREVHYEAGLYLAEPGDILRRLQSLAAPEKTVLVVGHNPGLHMLALSLVGGGAAQAIARLAQGFPTAALAVFDVKGKDWSDLAPGRCALTDFIVPRDLD
ncbi:MAG: histidine phosphatase family protein [Hyphomicrobiaceae bacterium]|nr:histidine phosphatase family protein [Hyphomicrobiaceae bacterium]